MDFNLTLLRDPAIPQCILKYSLCSFYKMQDCWVCFLEADSINLHTWNAVSIFIFVKASEFYSIKIPFILSIPLKGQQNRSYSEKQVGYDASCLGEQLNQPPTWVTQHLQTLLQVPFLGLVNWGSKNSSVGSHGVEAKGYLSAFSDRVGRYASPCSSFLELLFSSTFLQDLTSRNQRSLSFLSFLLSGRKEKERLVLKHSCCSKESENAWIFEWDLPFNSNGSLNDPSPEHFLWSRTWVWHRNPWSS